MSEWVKCSERMPQRGVPVIVWRRSSDWQIVRAQEATLKENYGALLWRIRNGWYHPDFVTHWMPLPEPPHD